jgi:hypothetical protein
MQGRITISSSRRYTAFTLDLPPAPRTAPEPLQSRIAARAGA